jgi:shikimate dehydrogenase
MKTYALVGHPCKHSLSPVIHNAAFQALEIPAKFEIFDTENLEEFMEKVRAGEIVGGSVTMPFKNGIIEHLEQISEDVREIDACNCIRGLEGFNTDWYGALRALEEVADLNGKRVYLIGAGGAAAAIAHGLFRKNLDLKFFNRTVKPGVLPLEAIDENFDILINATSCGFKSDESCVPKEILGEGKIVMDAVYEPLETRLLKEAAEAGCTVVTGEKMLLYQGFQAFEIWTGEAAPAEIMRDALYSSLKNSDPA